MRNGKNKAQQRVEETKKQIFFTAMRLFAEHGYDNVSVDDIVERSHSSKASFYNYFRSKDELFVFYNQGLSERYEMFFRTLTSEKYYYSLSGLQKLYMMYMYILSAYGENGGELTRLSHMRFLREGLEGEDYLQGSQQCIQDITLALISHGQKDGSVDPTLDPQLLSDGLFSHLNGLLFDWETHGCSYDMLERWGYVLEFVCRQAAAKDVEAHG